MLVLIIKKPSLMKRTDMWRKYFLHVPSFAYRARTVLTRAIYPILVGLSRKTSSGFSFDERHHSVEMVLFLFSQHAEYPFRMIVLHRSLHLDVEVVRIRFKRDRQIEDISCISTRRPFQ